MRSRKQGQSGHLGNIDGLKQLAEQLLEKEVIFSEDLERIFGKRKGDHGRDLSDDKPVTEAPEIISMPEALGPKPTPAAPETDKTPDVPSSPDEHGE